MKSAIIAVPTNAHTELVKELIERGIEAKTIGIDEDNDLILRCSYEENLEYFIDEVKAVVHLLKFCKILERLRKRAIENQKV